MDVDHVDYKPDCQRKRWVSYFDLLGFKELMRTGRYLEVFEALAKPIENGKRRISYLKQLHFVWFSDTFLFYSDGNDGPGFNEMDIAVRNFTYLLLKEQIPLRGAMSCAELYADTESSVYFGPGLIEAFTQSESQDWIGFSLCQSAVDRLAEFKIGFPRVNYEMWPIPVKEHGRDRAGLAKPDKLPAYIIGQDWHRSNEVELPSIALLSAMKSSVAKKPEIAAKYDRAIEFIRKNTRKFKSEE